MRRTALLMLAAAAFLATAAIARAGDFVVIVNESNSLSSIDKGTLAKIFLKKTTKWSDSSRPEPVDQVDSSPAREAFSDDVLGKNVAAVKSYWQRQVFSGRGVPPEEKASDADVVAHVKSDPGGVGYVDAAASVSGVKVLSVR